MENKKEDNTKDFNEAMKLLTWFRKGKGKNIKQNGRYDLEDLKAFYKIVYSKVKLKKKSFSKPFTLNLTTSCKHLGKEIFCHVCMDKYKDKIKEIIGRELILQ